MQNLAESLEPSVPEAEIAAADDQPTQDIEKPEVEAKEASTEPEGGEKKQTMVPHAALHEERKRRQEIEARLRQQDQERAVMIDRYNQLLAATQKPAVVPDKEQQPLEYIDHELAQTKQKIAQFENWQQKQAQEAQQQQQVHALTGWAKNQAAQFAADKPDFQPAYHHVLNLKAKEFQAMGMTQDQLPQAISQYELWLFHQAHQSGRNPGEVIYETAKQTGFSQKAPAADKIQTLNKGMEASKTLGNGGQSGGMPTPEQIAAMSEDEFAVFKAKLSKSGKQLSDLM